MSNEYLFSNFIFLFIFLDRSIQAVYCFHVAFFLILGNEEAFLNNIKYIRYLSLSCVHLHEFEAILLPFYLKPQIKTCTSKAI